MRKTGLYLLTFSLVFLLVLGGFNGLAKAEFPEKTITFVSWASEGGGSDRFNNAVKHAIDENDLSPEPVVTICKPGGGGAMGMSYVMSQPANGYHVLKVSTNLVLTPLTKDVPYDYENFIPIARMGVEPEVLYVQGDSEWETIDDFLEYARNNKVKAGMYGTGTQNHVSLLALAEQLDKDFNYVPYDGGGKAIAALLGGHVDVVVSEPSEVAGQVEAGKLRPLLVYSEERVSIYPGTPAFASKFDSDIAVMQFRGYVVKEGTPDEVVNYLRDLFAKSYNTEELQNYMKSNNIAPALLKGEEFYTFVEDQVSLYEGFLSKVGLIE